MNNVAEAIIQAAKLLGNNNANTEMGALEAHGLMVKESGELISASLDACSCAFEDMAYQLSRIADAMSAANILKLEGDNNAT